MSRYFRIKEGVDCVYKHEIGKVYLLKEIDNYGYYLYSEDMEKDDVYSESELEEVFYNKYFIPSTCVNCSQEGGSYDRYDKRSDGWSFSTTLLGDYDPIWSSISLIDNKEKIRARFNIKKWK